MPSKRRVGKVQAVKAAVEQNKSLLGQEMPTPMGEPHRIGNPVTPILEAMSKLTGDEIDYMFGLLDAGMWDEWDCGLIGGIEMGFGGMELVLAAKVATGLAKYHEAHPETKEDK